MNCKHFSSLEGCNRCTHKLDNNAFTSLLDSAAIVGIFGELIKQCNISPITKVLLDKSTITCRGTIYYVYEPNDINDNDNHNRHACFQIINEWLKYNIYEIYETINIIYLLMCASILYYNETDQRASQILDNLEVMLTYIQRYIKYISK